MFIFVVDLFDRGIDNALAEIGDRAGVGGINVAAAYHHARDIMPNNPVRKLYFHEGGVVFFRPEPRRYGAIQPHPAAAVAERDPLADLCDAALKRDMTVSAWTVYLHNSRLSSAHPWHAPQNAFGDRNLTDLCPADPAVVEYAIALTGDICRYPVTSIMSEALHFKPIDHGYHHERYFVDLGPVARFLLGLCFCPSCLSQAQASGVDGDGVRRWTEGYLAEVFARGGGGHEPMERETVDGFAGGEMAGYLSARSASVTALVGAVAMVTRAAGVDLTFTAHGGSAKGGATHSHDSAASAWTLGIDLPSVVSLVDDFEILGYTSRGEELGELAAGYLDAIGPNRFAVALRPMWPDTSSAEDLAARVRVVRALGADRLDFYHYGLMPEMSLDWIGHALTA